MAWMSNFTCIQCGKEMHESSWSGLPDRICQSCRKENAEMRERELKAKGRWFTDDIYRSLRGT